MQNRYRGRNGLETRKKNCGVDREGTDTGREIVNIVCHNYKHRRRERHAVVEVQDHEVGSPRQSQSVSQWWR